MKNTAYKYWKLSPLGMLLAISVLHSSMTIANEADSFAKTTKVIVDVVQKRLSVVPPPGGNMRICGPWLTSLIALLFCAIGGLATANDEVNIESTRRKVCG